MRRLQIICAILSVLAACRERDTRRARNCLGYAIPAGWQLDASRTGADLVFSGPTEFPIGARSMHDTFIVRFMPSDQSLEAFKQQLLHSLTKDTVNKVASDEQRELPGAPTIKVDNVPAPTVTPVSVSGHEGFRVEVRSTLFVEGAPVDWVNRTLFVKLGSEVVDVTAGYLASREAAMKPVSDAFQASINFDRCKR